MRSCAAAFVLTICAVSFPNAQCQSWYEPFPIPDSDQPQTFRSNLLGISFMYPSSMVSVDVIQAAPQNIHVPENGVKDRGECLKNIGVDLIAIRNMRTDDSDAVKRAGKGPEGARALAAEEDRWPGVVARLSIRHQGLACLPEDACAHIMNSEYGYLPGGADVGSPRSPTMYFYTQLVEIGATTVLFSAAEYARPDSRDGRYWEANISFVSNGRSF